MADDGECVARTCRGSKFLKNWMKYLEDEADLRYPNVGDLYVDQQNAG